MNKRIPRLTFGYLFFVLGALIGLVFSAFVLWVNLEGMAFWGYPESITYSTELTTEAKISRLKCPIIITEGEDAKIAVRVSNPYEKATRAYVSAHLSMPGRVENMVRRSRSAYLEPDDESEIRWMINSENAIFDHMVLARVYLKWTEFHPPSRTQHCGIISADLWGLTGTQILALTTVSSLVLISLGGYLIWLERVKDSRKKNFALRVVFVTSSIISLCVLCSLFRIWEVILALFVLLVVFLISSFSYYVGKMENKYN